MKVSLFSGFWGILFLAVALAFSSCETSKIEPELVPSGNAYFPIEVGSFKVYRVDTTQNTFAGVFLKGTFYSKEKISDTLPDQEGAKVYRIEIYKTADTLLPWRLDSVWTVRVAKNRIIRTENNVPFLKLVFPLYEGSRWDGNQFNIGQDANTVYWYTVRNLGKKVLFGNQEVESVEIVQKIDSNCLNNSYFTEIYYKNIGLGFRRKSYKEYVSCVGIPVIEQGLSFDYTLIKYGKE